MSTLDSEQIKHLASAVRLAIFDVDGVLTDGSLIFGSNGEEYKIFNSRDGQGLVMLSQVIEVAIITGRSSPVVSRRMNELGIKHVFQGQKNKSIVFDQLLNEFALRTEQVCYVGDDLPDLAVMSQVGLPIAVADADQHVKEQAVWTTIAAGGRGAAREVCDLILTAKGQLKSLVDGVVNAY